jgi:CheY-like chemotaxis protein
MQKLQADAAAKGVVWLAICSSAPKQQGHATPADALKACTEKNSAATAYLIDESGATGRAYGAKRTPEMYVINADGILVYQGAIDDKKSVDPADIATAKNLVAAAIAALPDDLRLRLDNVQFSIEDEPSPEDYRLNEVPDDEDLFGLFEGAGRTVSPFDKTSERPLAEEFPLSVLLAEDNPVNQKVAARFLERIGYRADCVVNGLEAVEALNSRHYDLVLMDLQMPEMDGLEASRLIRKLRLDRQPKIIALTANAMQGDRELCLAAGMDDYVTKPVKIHEIAAAIRRQFSAPAILPQTIG